MKNKIHQFADLRTTRLKFDRQIANFKKQEASYRREGVVCLKVEFPVFEFAFFGNQGHFNINIPPIVVNGNVLNQMAIQTNVPYFLFAIRLDYSNFDVTPPSLRIIDPLTSELSLNVGFRPFITPRQQNLNSLIDDQFKMINQYILLTDNEGQLFICLRGLKEYHEHPQHNGDSWFLYRLEGAGDILNILDQLQLYVVSNYNGIAEQQRKIPFGNG